ncbi:AAA family ATPase [Rhodococcus erythropolis]|uniref:AAA family ATPase n=1 Tax=Rhodococcus erythropolis TaxID=1833 RepID=UPI00083F62B7|nr:SMC family ATPase [Rhodococcus erythropolis]
MRLHKLEVSSFGPFADTVEVDFDRLGADGLFLLHGDTGAGKTTILDAVSFALYGRVPGARNEGKRLLSDHAPAGSVPRVELEATISGRRIKLVRSPEYSRPKKRGTGSITENAKATLTWLDGRGENLSRIPDIGDEINRLMGMSADQFFQVVLLPQGEFAKFLRAESDERGKLLERLFDTKRFVSVEAWFDAKRKASATALAAREQSVRLLLAKVETAAGLEVGAEAHPLEWSRKLLAEAQDTRDASLAELVTAKDAAAEANRVLSAAQRTADLVARRNRATAELAAFNTGASQRAVIGAELETAKRALPVAAVAGDVDAAGLHLAAALESMTTAMSTYSALDGPEIFVPEVWPPTDDERQRVVARIRTWRDEIVRLDAMAEDARRADAAEAEIEKLGVRRDALSERIDAIAVERTQLPDMVRSAGQRLEDAQRAHAALPGLEAALVKASDAAAAAHEIVSLRAQAEKIRVQVLDARDAHQSARGRWLDLVQKRIEGMAAELASSLAPGDLCQVCGSREHPALAQSDVVTVTEPDLEAASAAERAAEKALSKVADRQVTVERDIDRVIARGGDGDSEELDRLRAEARNAVDEATHSAGQVGVLAQKLAQLNGRDTELQQESASLTAELAALAERRTTLSATVEQIRAAIVAAVGEDSTIAARRSRFEGLASAATAASEMRDDAVRAQARSAELSAKLAAAAAAAGFDSVEAAIGGVRAPARIAAIETELAKARDLEVAARTVLDDPEVVAVGEVETVDVDGPRGLALQCAEVVNSAVAAASLAENRVSDLERFSGQLEKAYEAVAPERELHDELAALADVIAGKGQNSRKMSLRAYVLASRLEEIAVSASVRLQRMSGGRYEFVHSDEAGSRGRRGGLGLDIRDDFTGVVRSAKTLSGGESFLASLSLALGLADVVAAESGGIVLDTMFIDEGFGTLDADTLDSVMAVLDELRDGGRVVGIVSHVDEMRQRIPSRLHVIRGRAGSSVKVIAG